VSEPRRIVLATRNPHKVAEIVRLAGALDVVFESLADHSGVPDVEETGRTFEENARLKARAVAAATGLPALADDSGLEVDALGGEPGVFSARYAGPEANDAANCALLLEKLAAVPDEKRTARFRCVIAYRRPDGEEWTVEGACEGRIGRECRGESGFGYDPLFFPVGQERTFAEMEGAEKDALSHRGQEVRKAGGRLTLARSGP
jgi:non-canonical purine NTP pyrophosphatase (RdgB/HAM1 family)